ncbi:hypothetical protein UNSWDHB_2466 [Dehalobacter sp. UNSWDHB]|jgi:Uncharacterized protein conserved in bacteria with the myosin-like domain|uniref:DUF3102 domain-containing protein n=1 Tax=unclassified Dehalobacter TaxID=2635733 RepID=UPI00028A840E|nr:MULTISPECIES: DUF3102 domain-containing protein [unclassified Dehalobacter]AFV02735.1 Protein export cytoplasm protein SecA ATPase RNA helicase [Dehalobacter sp. DCA]AFV05720.1 Protein export cytoplasm protein SecA ATPase RNA helicase [Dehalobacter sp. CF]EQB20226.1 hypothetical protein UNSWDHB_2466 [Dehalobacter sp. UNSWDHB]
MTYPAKDTATDPENDPVSNTVPDVISGRTPHVIAAEINMIKYQAENIYLTAIVEIGRRLTEAKAFLKFGEWGKWLEESVDFSQSRANKLMRIFKEYGEGQLTYSNSEPNPKLNYSQAVLLLGIPKEERAQFIVDMDVKGMTTQELRQAVKERTQARQEKDQTQQENADFQKKVEDQSGTITELTAELANLKAQLENVKASKEELAITARQLNDSLESLRKSSSAQSYERMRNNFMKSSLKVRANHLAFLCENLDQTVREVKQKLREIAPNDKETYIIYKNKVCDLMDVWRKDEAWSREACPCGDGQ